MNSLPTLIFNSVIIQLRSRLLFLFNTCPKKKREDYSGTDGVHNKDYSIIMIEWGEKKSCWVESKVKQREKLVGMIIFFVHC